MTVQYQFVTLQPPQDFLVTLTLPVAGCFFFVFESHLGQMWGLNTVLYGVLSKLGLSFLYLLLTAI